MFLRCGLGCADSEWVMQGKQVVDFIYLDLQWISYVVAYEFVVGIIFEFGDVVFCAGKEAVCTDDFIAFIE